MSWWTCSLPDITNGRQICKIQPLSGLFSEETQPGQVYVAVVSSEGGTEVRFAVLARIPRPYECGGSRLMFSDNDHVCCCRMESLELNRLVRLLLLDFLFLFLFLYSIDFVQHIAACDFQRGSSCCGPIEETFQVSLWIFPIVLLNMLEIVCPVR